MQKKTCLILLSLLIFFTSASCTNPSNNTYKGLPSCGTVNTTTGPVSGVKSKDGLSVFLGVPYALPPVGEYRFKHPRELPSHKDTFQATSFGNVSCQTQDIFEATSFYPQSEDCLNLDIWTPAADKGKRPVMVFIHGGGFISGASADHYYDGANLAKNGNLVMVSINYRLGALGYLYLEGYGKEGEFQSNCGLLDQVMALKWVRQNIENFGGDPDNVTVMGESAGSISATTLMTMPAARGLFRRVIAQSGSPSLCRTKEEALKITRQFLEIGGIKDANDLKSLSAQQIVEIQQKLIKKAGLNADRLFSPVIDGETIPLEPVQALAAGAGAGIDLMHGTTRDEVNWWILYEPAFALITPEILFKNYPETAALFGNDPAKIAAAYRQILKGTSDQGIAHFMLTDRLFWIQHVRLEEAQAPHAHTWMYMLAWRSPFAGGILGAYHSLDIPFVFHNFDDFGPASGLPDKLTDSVQKAWIAFATNGNPDSPGMPHWPEYDIQKRLTMIIDTESSVQSDPDSERRMLYSDIIP